MLWAIRQFTSILTEQCNYLGGTVFSNHVSVQKILSLVNNQVNKNELTTYLKSIKYTNDILKHVNLKYKFGNRHFWS